MRAAASLRILNGSVSVDGQPRSRLIDVFRNCRFVVGLDMVVIVVSVATALCLRKDVVPYTGWGSATLRNIPNVGLYALAMT